MKQRPVIKSILDLAACSKKNIYSATFFARRDISIIDQQFRALNLCYALSQSRKIKKSSHIGIVGAGFTGLTCALALAARHGCVISLFETDPILLRKFREASFRYLHPDLNPRDSKNWELGKVTPKNATTFPFLNWSGNRAPLVSEQVVASFEHYRTAMNIALHQAERVIDVGLKSGRPFVRLEEGAAFSEVPGRRELRFDILILATGFGQEKGSELTTDVSYWHSGNPGFYKPILPGRRARNERILVSGNGDSGVLELAHLLLKDFVHEFIFNLLPNSGFSFFSRPDFFKDIRSLVSREIERGNPSDIYISGPVSWYWAAREKAEGTRPSQDFPRDWKERYVAEPVRAGASQIFELINKFLSGYDRRTRVNPLLIRRIENLIERPLIEMASHEIKQLMDRQFLFQKKQPDDPFFWREMKRYMRRSFDVTMIGPTPTMYSSRQAPSSWVVLSVLQQIGERYGRRGGGFEYRQAELQPDKTKVTGSQIAAALQLPDGKVDELQCDRLIVRHGVRFDSLGYKKVTPKYVHSKYTITNEAVLGVEDHYKLDVSEYERNGSRLPVKFQQSELCRYFRTRRWRLAYEKLRRFEEPSSSELPRDDWDDALLTCCLVGTDVPALRWYKAIKAAGSDQKRAHATSKLRELFAEAIDVARQRHGNRLTREIHQRFRVRVRKNQFTS